MNNILEYKGYNGTVEYSADDNVLFGKVIGIKSLISYEVQSVEELKADFESAVDEYWELCAKKALSPKKPTKARSMFGFHPKLTAKQRSSPCPSIFRSTSS